MSIVTVSISNLSSNTGNQLVKIEHFYLILNAFNFDLSFFKLMVNFFSNQSHIFPVKYLSSKKFMYFIFGMFLQ